MSLKKVFVFTQEGKTPLPLPSVGAYNLLLNRNKTLTILGSDGEEGELTVSEVANSVDINATPISEKTKLQNGSAGDWVNGSYAGGTSGVIENTFSGQVFKGQDSTNNNYYLYYCVVNNDWVRMQIS